MRDRNVLPFLGKKMNKYRKSSLCINILDSIPEDQQEDVTSIVTELNVPSGRGNVYLKEHETDLEESQHDEAKEKGLNNSTTGITLPKLENKSNTGLDRGIRSPKSSSGFLNIANMRLSPRRENMEKPKRENDIKCANYLIYEPTVAEQVTADIDISRYAFRPAMDRRPETNGERLLSAHSKRKSNSAEKVKRDCTMTEKNANKKKQARSLKSLDLFDQQRAQIARKGPPTRVWFSYKEQDNHHETPDSFAKRLHGSAGKTRQQNEDFVFPTIVLYQWEVHHKQPNFIKNSRSRKAQRRLPVLHRIPTAPQEDQPGDKDGYDNGYDEIECNVSRSDSPPSKIPQPPPPTPRCQSCPSSSYGNFPD